MGTRVHKVRPIELEAASPVSLFSNPEGLFLMDGDEELKGEGQTRDAEQTRRRLEWLLTPPETMVRLLLAPSGQTLL